jgi:hypothetical protein
MIVGIRFLAAVVVAAMLGLAVGIPVLTIGLVVPIHVVGPLALAAGALPAALGAGWVGNLFTRDRSRLLLVVAVAEASAAVLCLVMLASSFLPGLFGPLIYTAAVCAGVVAISAGVAALSLRGPRGRLGWDGAAALLASAAGFVLGVSAGGAGLLPLIPDRSLVTLGYVDLAWISLVLMVAGASMAVLRSGRFSPGHELGRDAAATLALVAAIPPGVVGSISFACANLVGCSG